MKRNLRWSMLFLFVFLTVFSVTTFAADLINSEEVAEHAIVTSAHPLASEAGIEILKKGGNAVDAAVATAFAIGVVEPDGSGIGGEGLMVIYLAETDERIAIDYRSCAPKSIEQYNLEKDGPKSVAIPGTVAGLSMALENYGTMSLSEVLQPAIRYAEEGFEVSSTLAGIIMDNYEKLLNDPATAEVYLEDSFPKQEGDIIVQEDLAKTLKIIGYQGADAFYTGVIADVIAHQMKESGGIITKEDLATYRAIEREPVVGDYRGYEIISGPPPVSGMVVIEALNILENYDLRQYGYMSYDALHLMSEAVRLAYADRYGYMADPSFVDVPMDILLSKEYAAKRADLIQMDRQIPKWELRGAVDDVKEHHSTTHLVVADEAGNMVSLTQTLSSFFGSGYTVPGTGILLNNEMKNFSKSGINVMEPYKRMRTTIAPTVILKDGKPFMAVGSPGAARIVPAVLNIIVNVVDFDMGLQEAIEAPRFYSTSQSSKVYLEDRFPELVIKALEQKGYKLIIKGEMDLYFGGAQAALYDDEQIIGGADPRRDGFAVGY